MTGGDPDAGADQPPAIVAHPASIAAVTKHTSSLAIGILVSRSGEIAVMS